MSEYILTRRYTNHYGLDLKSSDLNRPIEYASDMMNAQYRKSGAIEKRLGYKPVAPSQGGHGLFTYTRVNPSTNVIEEIALEVSNTVHRVYTTSVTVTYSGSADAVLISIFYDTNLAQYVFQILEDTLIHTINLGTGFDEASPVTIANLVTAINAISNFSASASGSTSISAALLKIIRDQNLLEDSSPFDAFYSSEVNRTLATPFAGSETHKNDSDFENVTSAQLYNVIYLSNGYDNVLKYDGQNLYRAGLPTPAVPTSALGGAGAITGSNYYHKIQYIQYDAVGNIVEGNNTRTATGLNPAAQSINVTAANVIASTGFNTNCAIVAGAQAAVNTITVDDGSGGSHTMKVGDTAYFYDAVSASYVTRSVTAIAATTITVSGAAVTVADNAVISNNLRIAIYRNQTSATTPTVFYLVAEIPNNSFTATQVYNDNLTDAQLGVEFVEPLTDRSSPPKGKYISAFRNQLMLAGSLETPNTFYWSDVDGPEYFPNDGSHQNDVTSLTGTKITGIAPNNEVFAIFQKRAIHILSGDIATGNIRVDTTSVDLGCEAHASIQEIKGVLFFASEVGPRAMVGGQIPVPLGRATGDNQANASRIDPVFTDRQVEDEKVLKLQRSIGFHDRKGEKYLLYIPTESIEGSDIYTNSNAVIYAYDYTRDSWLKWTNMNCTGGITEYDGSILFSERRYSSFTTSVDHILYRRHDLVDAFDYQDHTAPIDFEYKTQWESLNLPSVLKRFLRINVFSLEELTGNDLVLNVVTEANYAQNTEEADITLDFTGVGYGISPWGDSPYGGSVAGQQKHKLSVGRHRSMRIIFRNERDQENVLITGYELEIATPYKIGLKV
jgi:hypothetical protein